LKHAEDVKTEKSNQSINLKVVNFIGLYYIIISQGTGQKYKISNTSFLTSRTGENWVA